MLWLRTFHSMTSEQRTAPRDAKLNFVPKLISVLSDLCVGSKFSLHPSENCLFEAHEGRPFRACFEQLLSLCFSDAWTLASGLLSTGQSQLSRQVCSLLSASVLSGSVRELSFLSVQLSTCHCCDAV